MKQLDSLWRTARMMSACDCLKSHVLRCWRNDVNDWADVVSSIIEVLRHCMQIGSGQGMDQWCSNRRRVCKNVHLLLLHAISWMLWRCQADVPGTEAASKWTRPYHQLRHHGGYRSSRLLSLQVPGQPVGGGREGWSTSHWQTGPRPSGLSSHRPALDESDSVFPQTQTHQ